MNKLLKKVLLLSSAIIMIASSKSFADTNIYRIEGSNRYDTSLKLSQEHFKQSNYVVIASGENYPDALIGGSLTSQIKSPMLLVSKNNISNEVLNEIKRFSPKAVFVLGGKNTISDKVIEKIKNETGTYTERISGKNRFETSHEINNLRNRLSGIPEEYFEMLTTHYWVAVNGYNFYDALYVAPYFGLYRTDFNMILYVSPSQPVIREADREWSQAIGDVEVIRDNEDFRYTYHTRGNNRYETSTIMAELFKKNINPNLDTVIITSGESYPDGLSASGLVGVYRAPILLTSKNHLNNSTKNFIKRNNIKRIIIVGGEKTISKTIENQLKQ